MGHDVDIKRFVIFLDKVITSHSDHRQARYDVIPPKCFPLDLCVENFAQGPVAFHPNSCKVVACVNIICDLMASNGITARWSFHRVWIAGKISCVKRAPGPLNSVPSYLIKSVFLNTIDMSTIHQTCRYGYNYIQQNKLFISWCILYIIGAANAAVDLGRGGGGEGLDIYANEYGFRLPVLDDVI